VAIRGRDARVVGELHFGLARQRVIRILGIIRPIGRLIAAPRAADGDETRVGFLMPHPALVIIAVGHDDDIRRRRAFLRLNHAPQVVHERPTQDIMQCSPLMACIIEVRVCNSFWEC